MAKEIIIDGVDVSECEYLNGDKCLCEYNVIDKRIMKYYICDKFPDCYYKSLKRKEWEIKVLQAENEKLKEEFEQTNKAARELLQENGNYALDNKYYKQALDEIELHCNVLENKGINIICTESILSIIKQAKGEE